MNDKPSQSFFPLSLFNHSRNLKRSKSLLGDKYILKPCQNIRKLEMFLTD